MERGRRGLLALLASLAPLVPLALRPNRGTPARLRRQALLVCQARRDSLGSLGLPGARGGRSVCSAHRGSPGQLALPGRRVRVALLARAVLRVSQCRLVLWAVPVCQARPAFPA